MQRKPSTKPTFPCPGCGKQLRKPFLYHHMRKQHGIYGGETGIQRTTEKAVAAEYHRPDEGTITVPIVKNSSQPRFRVLDSMKVLVDQDGALWIGEKIRD